MAGKHDDLIVGWAEGRGKNLAKSRNRTETWGTLKKILKNVHVTPERRKEFEKMSKDDQDVLKASNGWISGAQCKDGKRSLANILPRDILTIDIDYAPETILEDITEGWLRISGYEGVWHSSRRHTPEAPRVRLFMPMKRKVSKDEYSAIVRFIGWKLDPSMQLVDVVSYRPAQMMFKPTCSKDDAKDFFYHEQHGALLDPDKLLNEFMEQFDHYTNMASWPKHPNEELRKRADKAEDPRQKRGIIGTFCRTFDIFQAMDTFLPGKYVPGDEHSGHPRFTYVGSTSSNGAIVYDNGLFMYSHHGHDPICDMNVNAWDLVRIHLFGELDEKAREGTKQTDMPSFTAMKEMLASNKEFTDARFNERYDFANLFEDDVSEDSDDRFQRTGEGGPGANSSDDGDDVFSGGGSSGTSDARNGAGLFDDVEPDGGTDDGGSSDTDADPEEGTEHEEAASETREPSGSGSKPERPKPSSKRTSRKDWRKEILTYDENGKIYSTFHNVASIIRYDERLINAIWYNEFDKNIVLRKSIKPHIEVAPIAECRDKQNGDRWQDFHDITIRAILESPQKVDEGIVGYDLKITDRDLIGGIELAARSTPFHPIRDYLVGLKWDGKPRIDTMLSRFLQLKENEYHRQISRLVMIASVARVFWPGHKFDNAIIIQGEQGIGKSTFIKVLYGEDWFGELHCDLGDQQKVAEGVTGKWGIELPELAAFHKSDHNKAKAFMRRQHDDVRMAYDRRVSEFPRQCVPWGTTNDKKYLSDPTGNRSWWPVVCPLPEFSMIDLSAVAAERDQLWAEAVEVYFQMRAEKPKGDLRLELTGKEAIMEAKRLQDAARSEQLHEIWAAAIMQWLDTPVRYREFLQDIGATLHHSFMGDGGMTEETLVLRTVFTREQAVKIVMDRQAGAGVVRDHASTQNIAKALDLVTGWGSVKEVGRDGHKRRRILGSPAYRWIENLNASLFDRERGYTIFIEAEEDEYDVV